ALQDFDVLGVVGVDVHRAVGWGGAGVDRSATRIVVADRVIDRDAVYNDERLRVGSADATAGADGGLSPDQDAGRCARIARAGGHRHVRRLGSQGIDHVRLAAVYDRKRIHAASSGTPL